MSSSTRTLYRNRIPDEEDAAALYRQINACIEGMDSAVSAAPP